jgi:hypothetical protein
VRSVQLQPLFVSLAAIVFTSIAFGAHDASAPPVSAIIQKSVAANTADWKEQPKYSHRENEIKKKIDSNGQVKVEQIKTYEVMMIEGSPYYRVVAINNEPLSQAQEQQEQAKLNREILLRQNESKKDRKARLAKYQSERSEEHLLLQEMVSAFRFKLAGEEERNGVDCYVLDASPNPDYQPSSEKTKVLTGMQGRLWIDKTHYHWVRVQAQVITPVPFGLFIAKVKPGTKFELDQAPVGDVWLPKRFIENVNASVLGLYGMRSMEQDEYSDYHQTMLNADNRSATEPQP